MQDLKDFSKEDLVDKLSKSLSSLEDSQNKSDLEYLTHNLQTHQIELEMQNRELREAQDKLEESRDRYADLYDFSPTGYLTLNNKGCVTEINLTAASKIGVERASIINQPLTRWLAPEYRQSFLKHLDEVFNKKRKAVLEFKLTGRTDEAERDVQLESVPSLEDANNAFCRTAMIDITARKQFEMQLIQARDAAEKANQTKSQFLSRMSHEFRTPLNCILGFAQVLDIGLKGPVSPDEIMVTQQKENVEEILKAGRHMLRIVEHLLDMSAIEAGKLHLEIEAVDLAKCIEDSLNTVRPLVDRKELVLTSTVDSSAALYARADPVRLKQVLLNLLSNAVKYNQPGGSITISCEQAEAGAMRISVTDTGVGISEDDMPSLFEPFSRMYIKNNTREGTGIGLTICKQLVRLMNGRIGVTSEPGHGSTFWIELPLS